ncbi:gag-asp_proteas domain-containing protein [Gossypium australe]|uniref:Gag-asp_proteas domain-containing protein n=1 Tax=Gossypium australe TaxID=47621 RepID=A0A5B6VJ57_9ROSI|nr:gag-asp_proteas domain-containing protein [Gossypium australe]
MGNNSRLQNNPYSNHYNAGWLRKSKSTTSSGFPTPTLAAREKVEPRRDVNEVYLSNQIGQLAKLISERPQGSLPSNTETNPREQLYAITVRDEEKLLEFEQEPRQEIVVNNDKVEMPNYVKFLKVLLANKRKLDDSSTVELNAVCSAILKNKLPDKIKDPESFIIPYLTGSLNIDNALADLAASINVMPYKIVKQLGLRKPKQTRMSIQLADRTIRYLRGVIEDMIVKIDKFIFPVDFVVLDMDEDTTARTIIDVGTGELVFE